MKRTKAEELRLYQRASKLFWAKVEKTAHCWVWKASLAFGYGKFHVGIPGGSGQIHVRAHRYSWIIAHGRFPDNLILHTCDNRACVNPDHLEDGTQSKNISDCSARGRHARLSGERHPRARLTLEQAREIKTHPKRGVVAARTLAKKFGVSTSTVVNVMYGYNWRTA